MTVHWSVFVMLEINCKRCFASNFCKNGFMNGRQRYLCKDCGCNFTSAPKRGKSSELKALALRMYAVNGISFRGIGLTLGVSDVSVLRWVRAAAQALKKPEIPPDTKYVMVDEMHHFVQKKHKNSGYGVL
jgi:transposase